MYIYKITNLINNKKYIGKTNDIKRRKREHFSNYNIEREPNKILYKAMLKYGKGNFLFEIIEECDDSIWEDREKYWIEHCNSLIPNGYNMIDGGSEPPHYVGESSLVSKLTDLEVKEIQNLLLKYNFNELSNKEIASKYNISTDQISRINSGKRGYNKELSYPLRKYSMSDNVDEIISLLDTWEYSCQEIANMFNVSKSCIKEINRGKNHHRDNIVYPIKPQNVSKDKNSYKKAYSLLEENKQISYISKETGLGYSAIKSIKEGKFDCYLKTCND